jgi:signal transduction histidine kinase
VRTRIIGLALVASVLAIGLFGVPLGLAVARYAVLHEESNLVRIADAAAVAVSSELKDGDPPSAIPEALDHTSLAVYDRGGTLIAGHGPAADELVQEALTGRIATGGGPDELVAAVTVNHESDVLGAVRAASPRSEVYGQVGLAWLGMTVLALLAVAVVWLLARRQARRLAQPLEQLAGVASRLGDGDFSVRTTPVGIPEIDSVGHALSRTATRLDTMLARERAFSADASHQLRTPLAGLRLRLEAALHQLEQDPYDAIRHAIIEADRQEQIIDELLALARDTRHSDSGPLDLTGLLDEIDRTWSHQLAAKQRQLHLDIDPQAPGSSASTAAVRQVLTVLLDNAAAHGAGAVTLSVRDAAGALAIDVSDEGAEITTPELILFTRRAEGATGHGIGLALARSLAEAEGGRLTLSRPIPPTFTLLAPPIQH